jgi:CRP-like cAMP-binding protein
MGREHLFEQLLAALDAGHVVANERTFDKGDIVFHQGDPGDRFTSFEKGCSPSGRPRLWARS